MCPIMTYMTIQENMGRNLVSTLDGWREVLVLKKSLLDAVQIETHNSW